MTWRVAVVFLSAGWLAAQDAPPARDIRQLEVPHHQGQSYWMFAPANYTADRAWPILYCLDPGARGRVPVERFAAAAEKAGFLVAGSNNSRNGPMAPVQEAINLMVADTHALLHRRFAPVRGGFLGRGAGGAELGAQRAYRGGDRVQRGFRAAGPAEADSLPHLRHHRLGRFQPR